MRVIEPGVRRKSNKSSNRKFPLYVYITLILIVLYFGASQLLNSRGYKDQSENDKDIQAVAVGVIEEDIKQSDEIKKLRVFSDTEFRVFYSNLVQPNLDRVENPPHITGNDIADTRIRKIGEERGYRLRHSPTVDLVSTDGYLLQQAVVIPWQELKKEAAKDGIDMRIVSAYRSVSEQRTIFLNELAMLGATTSSIAAGNADALVDKVLVTASIPGYSKHHTGYTIDLYCPGYKFENFKDSTCFEWLSANNYQRAKEHGFIPSYPPLVIDQGPNPEAWEYVYVGTEMLYE